MAHFARSRISYVWLPPSSGGQDILHIPWKQQKALLNVIIIKVLFEYKGFKHGNTTKYIVYHDMNQKASELGLNDAHSWWASS